MSDISHIDGQSVRLKRETMGWAMTDLATLACLSVKQIKQIEEGGTSAFYSESVKLTAARKVAGLLQMTEDELFGQVPAAVAQAASVPDLAFEPVEHAPLAGVLADRETAPEAMHAPLMRSEALHILAQPPEDLETSQAAAEHQDAPTEQTALVQQEVETEIAPAVEATDNNAAATEAESASPASGGNYLIKIVALFILAIAVAAVLRPKAGDDKAETANQESPAPVPAPMPVPGAANDNQTSGAATEAQTAAPNTPTANAPVANSPSIPAAATAEKPVAEKPATAVNATPAAGDTATSTNGK